MGLSSTSELACSHPNVSLSVRPTVCLSGIYYGLLIRGLELEGQLRGSRVFAGVGVGKSRVNNAGFCL